MNAKSLALLEKVFSAEIDGAINGGSGLYQTKSLLARRLEDEGYLRAEEIKLPGRFPVTIRGYRLTLLGNFTYCMNCPPAPTDPAP